jgi:hypothetical protein
MEHVETLEQFNAIVQLKKQRAEKFGQTYELTELEKKTLRRLKFGEPTATPTNKKNKKKNTSDADTSKKAKVSVDLSDPVIQQRLLKFGAPPEKSMLSRVLKEEEEAKEKEQRRQRFSA